MVMTPTHDPEQQQPTSDTLTPQQAVQVYHARAQQAATQANTLAELHDSHVPEVAIVESALVAGVAGFGARKWIAEPLADHFSDKGLQKTAVDKAQAVGRWVNRTAENAGVLKNLNMEEITEEAKNKFGETLGKEAADALTDTTFRKLKGIGSVNRIADGVEFVAKKQVNESLRGKATQWFQNNPISREQFIGLTVGSAVLLGVGFMAKQYVAAQNRANQFGQAAQVKAEEAQKWQSLAIQTQNGGLQLQNHGGSYADAIEAQQEQQASSKEKGA